MRGGQWYKGQLHMHTYWSDGRAFPEQAVQAYKKLGYDFLALTDHNRLDDNKGEWREVVAKSDSWPPKVTRENYDWYLREFGEDWVDSRLVGDSLSVRLKTFDEVKARYDEPGKFLMLPGVELTHGMSSTALHMNYLNLPVYLPCIEGAGLVKTEGSQDVAGVIARDASEAKAAGARLGQRYMLMLNHPFWVYCDVLPESLIANPDVRFFEISNNGSKYAPRPGAFGYTPDKFWDVVNAFRAEAGERLLFGVGSDDTHYYRQDNVDDSGWVMVRANSLSPDALLAAMDAGDFYSSTGVVLSDVAFANGTLSVKVKPEPGVDYRIVFISTRRGFDRRVSMVTSESPARTIPVYSNEIGGIVKTVVGTEGSYRLRPDDLYVRAKVVSSRRSGESGSFQAKYETAWTQVFGR